MAENSDAARSKRLRPDSKIRRNPNVVARALGDEEGGVLLHLDSGAYHGVNQVGLLIWELVDGERTVEGVIDAVRASVVNGPPDLDGDVVGFLDRVIERNLAVVVE
jgi:hypothetical protein